MSPHNWVGPEVTPRHSVRQELLQLLLDEADYRGNPVAPATWALVVADMLATREMFSPPPAYLQAVTNRGNAVLKRWRQMHTNNLYRKARKAGA